MNDHAKCLCKCFCSYIRPFPQIRGILTKNARLDDIGVIMGNGAIMPSNTRHYPEMMLTLVLVVTLDTWSQPGPETSVRNEC